MSEEISQQDTENGDNKLKGIVAECLSCLIENKGEVDINDHAQLTNKMRFVMLSKISDEIMKSPFIDKDIMRLWKDMVKDIDAIVINLAKISQEDKHLDNEEMVARALAEVSKRINVNPYALPDDVKSDEITGGAQPPVLDDGEFDLIDGSTKLGMDEMTFDQFSEAMKNVDVEEGVGGEDEDEGSKATPVRDTPLPPPSPDSVRQ